MSNYKFEACTGFFAQDTPGKLPSDYNALDKSFGLLDQSPERWSNFKASVDKLNAEAPQGVSYKVFYMSRHGQGWHNLATRHFGRDAWNNHWCHLDSGDGMTWGPDSKLTPEGQDQARAVNIALKRELAQGMPPPTSLYCSPLSRAIQTCELQIHDVFLNKGMRPMVREHFREHYGEHSCDKRSSKTDIAAMFPFLDFEPGFAETDPWWKPDEKESFEHHMGRTATFLDQVFSTDSAQFIALFGHHGNVGSSMYRFWLKLCSADVPLQSDTAFKLIGHEHYALKAGEMVPFIVKATRQ